jgi:hypothetical protein
MTKQRAILRGTGRIIALVGVALFAICPAFGDEKPGMPDLSQIEQTCLPTATANLMLWFGHHGYPKLIMSGATEDERDLHTVHQIMTDTDARFDFGTRQDKVTIGIEKFISDAGYSADVEYRGLGGEGEAFSPDWLKENDKSNKGFVLLLVYCRDDPQTHVYVPAWNAGHAVTLVNAEPDMLLIHDPAHEDDETGRKIITPYTLTEGTFRERGESAPVAGLMLLSGSLLEGPGDGDVMLSGAVCVTMHPIEAPSSRSKTTATETPAGNLAGNGAPAGPVQSTSSTTWWGWIFNLLFSK